MEAKSASRGALTPDTVDTIGSLGIIQYQIIRRGLRTRIRTNLCASESLWHRKTCHPHEAVGPQLIGLARLVGLVGYVPAVHVASHAQGVPARSVQSKIDGVLAIEDCGVCGYAGVGGDILTCDEGKGAVQVRKGVAEGEERRDEEERRIHDREISIGFWLRRRE